jgi:hypothetical protein
VNRYRIEPYVARYGAESTITKIMEKDAEREMFRRLNLNFQNLRQNIRELRQNSMRMYELSKASYFKGEMESERNRDERRLLKHGYRSYSQNDEDGIIAEIFNRVEPTTKTFIEFGVGDGSECNTLNLLICGWRGLWLESDAKRIDRIHRTFGKALSEGQLLVEMATIAVDNINDLLVSKRPAPDVDLLSIDVDGNDYWLWGALTSIAPRVVVVEYNALWRPPIAVTMRYNPRYRWMFQSHFGASLKALEQLGARKGYNLVGCCFGGVNAFFVRQDLCGDKFCSPFTAENHYEPSRSFMGGYPVLGTEGTDSLQLV